MAIINEVKQEQIVKPPTKKYDAKSKPAPKKSPVDDQRKVVSKKLPNFLFSLTIIAFIAALLFGFILPKTKTKNVPSNDFTNSIQLTYQVENEGNYSEDEIIASINSRIEASGVVNYSLDYAKSNDSSATEYAVINVPIDSKFEDWHVVPAIYESTQVNTPDEKQIRQLTDDGLQVVKSLMVFDLLVSQHQPIEFRDTAGIELFNSSGKYISIEDPTLDSSTINEQYVVKENSAKVIYKNSNPLVAIEPYSETEWLTMVNGQIQKMNEGSTDSSGNPIPTTAQFVDVWVGYDFLTALLDARGIFPNYDNYTRCYATGLDETSMPVMGTTINPVCSNFYVGRIDVSQNNTIGSKGSQIVIGNPNLSINEVNWFVNRINYSTQHYSMTFIDSHFVDPTFSFYFYYLLFIVLIVGILTAMILLMKMYGLVGAIFAFLEADFVLSNYLISLTIGIPFTMLNIIVFSTIVIITNLVIFYVLKEIKGKLLINTEVGINKLVNKTFSELNQVLGMTVLIVSIGSIALFLLSSVMVQIMTLTIILSTMLFYAMVVGYGYANLSALAATKEANDQRDVNKDSKIFGKAVGTTKETKHHKAIEKLLKKDVKMSSKRIIGYAFMSMAIAFMLFGFYHFLILPFFPTSFTDENLKSGPVAKIQFNISHEMYGDQYSLTDSDEDMEIVNAIVADIEAGLDSEAVDLKADVEINTFANVSVINAYAALGSEAGNNDVLTDWYLSQTFYGVSIYFSDDELTQEQIDSFYVMVNDVNTKWKNDLVDDSASYVDYQINNGHDDPVVVTSFYNIDNSAILFNTNTFIIAFLVFILITFILNLFLVGKDGASSVATINLTETLSYVMFLLVSFPVVSTLGFAMLYLVLLFSLSTKVIYIQGVKNVISQNKKKHASEDEIRQAINISKQRFVMPTLLLSLIGIVFASIGLLILNLTLISVLWFYVVPFVICSVFSILVLPKMLEAKMIKTNQKKIENLEHDRKLTEDPDLLEEKLVEGINY